MGAYYGKKSGKYEKDLSEFKKNNPELYEKLQGNLSARQRAIVEKNRDINVKFGEIYNGHSTKLSRQYNSDVTRGELSKIIEVVNALYDGKTNARFEIRDDDVTRYEYQKYLDKGATDIPYEEILCISKADPAKKEYEANLYFTTLDSELAFDERQDSKSFLNYSRRDNENPYYYIFSECTNALPDDGNFDLIRNRLENIGYDKSLSEILDNNGAGHKRELKYVRETLLESSGEIFNELKPVEKDSITYRVFNELSDKSLDMEHLEEQGYEMYSLSKGKKGLTNVYKDIAVESSYDLKRAACGIYAQICEAASKIPDIDENYRDDFSRYAKKFEKYHDNDLDTPYPVDAHIENVCRMCDVKFKLSDFKEELEAELGCTFREDCEFLNNKSEYHQFLSTFGRDPAIRMEVIEFNYDLGVDKKDINNFVKTHSAPAKPRENILMIHPDDKGLAIDILNRNIEKAFKDPRPIHNEYSVLDVQLEKYKDVIQVQKNLEHTVKQGIEYASIFNEKKNINQRTLDKMETSPFNEHFKRVEFDNDVEFESFDTKGSGKAVMDSLEKAVSDIAPILEKAKCEDVDLRFRKLGNIQKKSNKGVVEGVYIPAHNCIAIDINKDSAYRSLVHEVGHRIDFTLGDEVLSNTRDFQENVGDVYKREYNRIANDGKHEMMKNESVKNYLLSGTEIFARSYEFVLNEKGIASDFTKNDDEITSERNGYIFHLMDDKSKEKIIDYMERTVGIEKDVEQVLENRSKRLGIDISELKADKSEVSLDIAVTSDEKDVSQKESLTEEKENISEPDPIESKNAKFKQVGLPFPERDY